MFIHVFFTFVETKNKTLEVSEKGKENGKETKTDGEFFAFPFYRRSTKYLRAIFPLGKLAS